MAKEIIDFHTHFFSWPFFEALINQSQYDEAEAVKKIEALSIKLPPKDIKIYTQYWIDEMDKNKISHMVTFASLPDELDSVAKAVSLSKGRLSGMVLVNPMVKASLELIQKAAKLNFRGLILFPVMHGFKASSKEIFSIYEAAREYNMIILIHFGMLSVKLRDILGLPRPYDQRYGNPLDILLAANKFRDLKFIIPHFGCGFFREALMLGAQCENIYLDTSSSNSWLNTQVEDLTLSQVFKKSVAVFGAKRILFGTDSGILPRAWRQDIYQGQLEAMNNAGLSDKDIQLVLCGNAKKLLNI